MTSVSGDDKKSLALDFLSRAKGDLERAKRTRVTYARAAREHGVTNQQIGDALGVTEARVRQILAVA